VNLCLVTNILLMFFVTFDCSNHALMMKLSCSVYLSLNWHIYSLYYLLNIVSVLTYHMQCEPCDVIKQVVSSSETWATLS